MTGSSSEQVKDESVYLFSYFKCNGGDGLHLAYSKDGLAWHVLKDDTSFLAPKIGSNLMRDPFIIKGPDELFHMTWTTGWKDHGIGIAHSEDLIEWSDQTFVPIMKDQQAKNCWAPEMTWNPEREEYVIYWASCVGERSNRMYFTTTRDFEEYAEPKLFYDPGFGVIDSTIVNKDSKYVMIVKIESEHPSPKRLVIATSDRVTGPWSEPSEPFTPEELAVEGPTCIRNGEHWYLYYDAYRAGHYGAMRTRDFKSWEDMTNQLEIPTRMRHGSIFTVSQHEIDCAG